MSLITEIKWCYLFMNNTYLRVAPTAKFIIGKNSKLINSKVYISNNSVFEIGNNVTLKNVHISMSQGRFHINDNSKIYSKNNRLLINIELGQLYIGHHSQISNKRIWIRFGGKCSIGNYTNINEGSEIRCDDCIKIGDYNQISYNVNIWDTNTHNILSKEERRRIAEEYYPYYGKELTKPITSPIIIGDDCWIGQNVTLLKGSRLGNEVIVGYGSLIAGKEIPNKTTVVTESHLKIIPR